MQKFVLIKCHFAMFQNYKYISRTFLITNSKFQVTKGHPVVG